MAKPREFPSGPPCSWFPNSLRQCLSYVHPIFIPCSWYNAVNRPINQTSPQMAHIWSIGFTTWIYLMLYNWYPNAYPHGGDCFSALEMAKNMASAMAAMATWGEGLFRRNIMGRRLDMGIYWRWLWNIQWIQWWFWEYTENLDRIRIWFGTIDNVGFFQFLWKWAVNPTYVSWI